MEHYNPKDRDRAIQWARAVLARKEQYVILDTETNGLEQYSEIVQIAVINLSGETLLNSYMKPHRLDGLEKAAQIHGITADKLKDAPTYRDLRPAIKNAIKGKTVIAYNCAFDSRLLEQTAVENNGWKLKAKWECAMLPYSAFVGTWWDSKKSYKWQKLPGGDHDALEDCKATLKVIEKMADAELRPSRFSFGAPFRITLKPYRPHWSIIQWIGWWMLLFFLFGSVLALVAPN